MSSYQQIALRRDCEATQIPSGRKVILPAGTWVTLVQALGGAYTVTTEQGYLVRIEPNDVVDALGQEVAALSQAETVPTTEGPLDESMVLEQLKTVYDPEIPINIVDLGLVYDCRITPLPQGGNKVYVSMTMTAPGCGMGEVLKVDAEGKILALPGVKDARVEVVFDPPWSPDMMSDEAKLTLGWM